MSSKVQEGVSVVAMAEQGAVLPMGVELSGSFAKPFSIRPWRLKEEKELALVKRNAKDASFAQYVTMVLSTMCTGVGSYDFTSDEFAKEPTRRVIISQMYMGDVFYMYTYLRRESIGNEMAMKIKCAACAKDYDYSADLGTLGVHTAPSLAPFAWTYRLKHPITIRSKRVESFRMGPPRWSVLEGMGANPTDGTAKEAIIIGAIVNFNDEPGAAVLASSELQELSKYDLEKIATEVDQHVLGPVMALEFDGSHACPHCGHKENRTIPIDWRHDHFFGVSSR